MLNSLNKDLLGSDPLGRLDLDALRALETSLQMQIEAIAIVSAGERLSFDETIRERQPLLDQVVAVRLELLKRESRLLRERGAFWVVATFSILGVLVFMLWFLSVLLRK